MCDFQKLAFSEHGYIVRCIECGYFQIGFGTTMLTISNEDFDALYNTILLRLNNLSVKEDLFSNEMKGICIATPSACCSFILTKKELQCFYDILDKADNEIKALSLLQLFHKSSL